MLTTLKNLKSKYKNARRIVCQFLVFHLFLSVVVCLNLCLIVK